jgi:hypothetical protein
MAMIELHKRPQAPFSSLPLAIVKAHEKSQAFSNFGHGKSNKKSQTPFFLANVGSHRKSQSSFSFSHHWNSKKNKIHGKKLKHTQTQKCCKCIHNWGTKKE